MLQARSSHNSGEANLAGLTTGNAPFNEAAHTRGEIYVAQPYELYSAENHRTWARLFQRMQPYWERYATPRFREGQGKLGLLPDRIPKLDEINLQLRRLTGFQARAVAGYVPAYLFFDCLYRREFPTTITIRPATNLDYLPEPDIFHDVAGHVPMHSDAAFAEALVQFGACAHAMAQAAAADQGEAALHRLSNGVKAMARLFWFTVEFGLMRGEGGRLYACGSGLLSSHGELQHAMESAAVRREPFTLERVIHQTFDYDRYQMTLFVLDSFEQLFEAAARLEHSILEGTLGEVAPGQPETSDADLASFLRGGA